MKTYLELVRNVLENGVEKSDRTGTGTLSIFGYQSRYELSEGFPLVTTKKIHIKSVIHELLWFLKGDTNIQYLKENKVRIWDEWADKNGDLGRIYGAQWRSWMAPDGKKLDQLASVVQQIKENPDSRRHLVVAYNPGELNLMALPPCHAFFQFYVANGEISLQMYQRSADVFLGVPFNIASYSLLLLMVAQITGLKAKTFIHTLGDAHLYLNHLDQARLQLTRTPKPRPKVVLNPEVHSLFDFCFEDIVVSDYNPHSGIRAEVAI